jgi:RNA polymerase sigma factor (sigma-70 family)
MNAALGETLTSSQQDRLIALTVQRESARLLSFIRRRIADAAEAEDILQETLYELVLAYRMLQPIEQAGAWLMRVARNRIIDRFRRKGAGLADLLPAPGDGPEAEVMRAVLLSEIEAALAQLPAAQREVFVAHELEGLSFRELSARTGVSINTLLSRKHYATQFLRERLQALWADWLSS